MRQLSRVWYARSKIVTLPTNDRNYEYGHLRVILTSLGENFDKIRGGAPISQRIKNLIQSISGAGPEVTFREAQNKESNISKEIEAILHVQLQ